MPYTPFCISLCVSTGKTSNMQQHAIPTCNGTQTVDVFFGWNRNPLLRSWSTHEFPTINTHIRVEWGCHNAEVHVYCTYYEDMPNIPRRHSTRTVSECIEMSRWIFSMRTCPTSCAGASLDVGQSHLTGASVWRRFDGKDAFLLVLESPYTHHILDIESNVMQGMAHSRCNIATNPRQKRSVV